MNGVDSDMNGVDPGTDIAALRAEVAALRSALAGVERRLAGAEHPAPGIGETAAPLPVSRRGLLGVLPGVAAVGAVGVGAVLATAAPAFAGTGSRHPADAGAALILGHDNYAGATSTSLNTDRTDGANGNGLSLVAGNGTVSLQGGAVQYADVGLGDPGLVIDAYSPGPGLQVAMTTPDSAFPSDFAAAVGLSVTVDEAAVGAKVTTDAGPGIQVATGGLTSAADAVEVSTVGLGRAVYAVSTNAVNARGTVTALNHGAGPAVYGQVLGAAANGGAVVGVAAAHGRGGRFAGGAAAVTLVPVSAATHPASGTAGDLVVDRYHRLWFCRGGASWKQLA